jgi:hypothetical protein
MVRLNVGQRSDFEAFEPALERAVALKGVYQIRTMVGQSIHVYTFFILIGGAATTSTSHVHQRVQESASSSGRTRGWRLAEPMLDGRQGHSERRVDRCVAP